MALKMSSIVLIGICACVTVYASAPIVIDAERPSIFNDPNDNPAFKLTNDVEPIKYEVAIAIGKNFENPENRKFTGEVKIVVKVKPDATKKTIEINSKLIKIKSRPQFKKTGEGDNPNLVTEYVVNESLEKVIITLNAIPQPGAEYVLYIEYEGQIQTDLRGLYLGSYQNKDNAKQYYLATQFEPTNARKVMPCFDEPSAKATFIFTLKYPSEYNALHNTKPSGDREVDDNNIATQKFQVTPKMSTYLLAIIISKFHSISTKVNGIEHNVWSRYDKSHSGYALEISQPLIDVMKLYTKKDFSDVGIEKIDHVALPEFSAGAMENWGLVTYREAYLLRNEESTTRSSRNILTIVAHELSHFWFGNLKTTKWYDTIWLNEGFARFFEYMAAHELDASWELDKQFVIEQHLAVLNQDSSVSSPALNRMVYSPKSILSKFDGITYSKGGSIIRMLSKWTTEEKCIEGLQKYFATQFDSATPADLWTAMDGIVTDHPFGKKLPAIMDNYVNKAGFPLITLVLEENNTVKLTQKRFLFKPLEDKDKDKEDHVYPVRVGYQTGEIGKLETVTHVWLEPLVSISYHKSENKMVLVNVDAEAYARVNYGSELWKQIIKALKTKDFGGINDITRAQLVDDALNIARASKELLPYDTALELLTYLKEENSYYPWYTAFRGIEYLLRRFPPGSDESKNIKTYVLELMKKVYETNYKDESQHVRKLKNSLTKSWACNLGDSKCIAEMKVLFSKLKSYGIEIDNDIKSTAYCVAVRDDEENWGWLYENKLVKTTSASDARLVLAALGCTKAHKHLETLLKETIKEGSMVIGKQDISYVFVSAMSGNPENLQEVTKFFQNYHQAIERRMDQETVSEILPNLIDRFTSEKEVKEFQTFLDGNNGVWFKEAAVKLLAGAKENYEWAAKSKIEVNNFVTKYLKRGDKEKEKDKDKEDKPSGAGSVNISVSIVVCNVFALILYFRQ